MSEIFNEVDEALGMDFGHDSRPTLPVKIVDSEAERVSPEFASFITWTVPQAGTGSGVYPYIQILQRRIHRYKAKFNVNLGAATALVFNSKPDQLTLPTPVGFTVSAGESMPDYDSQQPLYVTAIGGANATLSVMDEAYGEILTGE